MTTMTACNHEGILRNWSRSAEHNRSSLSKKAALRSFTFSLSEHNPHGHYSVRLEGSSKWVYYAAPPHVGAAEWLFVNNDGVPLFYWNKESNSVILIG